MISNLDPDHSYEHYLKPKLTESGLNFKNLYWESKENKVNLSILNEKRKYKI